MLLWVCLAYNCASSSNLYKNALQTRRLKFPTIIKRFQSFFEYFKHIQLDAVDSILTPSFTTVTAALYLPSLLLSLSLE